MNGRKPSRYIPKAVKEAVEDRDGDRCRKCGRRSEYLEWDHITPHSKGAPATVDNIQRLCRKCNQEKKAKTDKCPSCDGWISHDASYCHHCSRPVPRSAKTIAKPYSYWGFRQRLGLLIIIAVVVYLVVQAMTPQVIK